MERYNVLYSEGESPGIRVVRIPTYLDFFPQNFELPFTNFGTFYSSTQVDGLAHAALIGLSKDHFGLRLTEGDLVTVGIGESPKIHRESDYLFQEHGGIRILSPKISSLGFEKRRAFYEIMGYSAVEEIFSREKIGSFQTESLRKSLEYAEFLSEFSKSS